MIRVLLAINFGLAVAAAFAICEALRESPKLRRRDELATMIVDLSHEIEGVDTTITPEEITEVERFLGFAPLEMAVTGKYGQAWPFDTIGEDSAN